MNGAWAGRLRWLARILGGLGWIWLGGLLQRRGLHALQLESYQTARFLRWWLRTPTRVAPPMLLGGLALGLLLALVGRRGGPFGSLADLGWAGLGLWLPSRARFAPSKKPLVMTARAGRLAAGQVAVSLAVGLVARRHLPPTLTLAAVGAPLLVGAANLLLWPLEEAFRRYYLREAGAKLRRLAPTVVAVAGSYGKTSTKEFLGTILSARYAVLRPPGSHNTPMGIARVIREQLDPGHEIFVAELGDWVPGDIALLCRLLRPTVGVLTAIGPEHLERFKTMERVEASKRELLEALPADGTAVVNQDDAIGRRLADRAERSWAMRGPAGARVLRYGLTTPGANVRARDVRTSGDGLAFVVESDGHGEAAFNVGVLGRHNVSNLLAATAAALALGMSLSEIAAATARIRPVEHRLQPLRGPGGILVIDDAFNANPKGAAAALDVLAELEARRRILVTPGMVELAEREFEENRRFARQAAAVCDAVIVVGQERAAPFIAGLRDGGFGEDRLHVVHDLPAARARLETLVGPGDVVLFENDLPDTYADVATATDGAAPAAPPLPPLAAPSVPREVLEIDGLRLAYRDLGQAGRRPPVVLLHGWGASLDAVASIQQALTAEHRVLAFDLPGFGQSDPPPAAWASADYAALLERALDRLGLDRVHLIGHSRGGAIAIVLAASRPSLVERLVLVDSAGLRPARGPRYRARVAAYKVARRFVRRRAAADWLSRRFGSADYRSAGRLRSTLVRLVNEDLRPLLPRVAAPTLLIWGDQDEETPLRDAAIMEQEITDAGLVVFPGAGHFAYADDPGRFAAIVGHFLKA